MPEGTEPFEMEMDATFPEDQGGYPLMDTLLASLQFVLGYFHIFVMGGLLIYFVLWPRLKQAYTNRMDRIPKGGHYKKAGDAPSREEALRRARERQMEKVKEVSVADAEARAIKAAKLLVEEQRKQDERMSREWSQSGRRLGGEDGGDARDEGPRRVPASNNGSTNVAVKKTTKKKEDDEENPRKLPKLPGSDRQAYEPFPSGRYEEGGGRYRPTGFSRDCGPKGG